MTARIYFHGDTISDYNCVVSHLAVNFFKIKRNRYLHENLVRCSNFILFQEESNLSCTLFPNFKATILIT